jgi:hypothetical protein
MVTQGYEIFSYKQVGRKKDSNKEQKPRYSEIIKI